MFLLLELRDKFKNIYDKYSVYFNVVFKFIFSLVLFITLSKNIGFDTRFSSGIISVALALVGAFVPVSLLTLIALVLCGVHLLKISYICTVAVILVYLILWLLLLRYSSKLGYVFLAMPVLFVIGAPYLMPLLMGMTATPVAAIPIFCGAIMFYLLKVCVAVENGDTNVDPDEILQLYRYIMKDFVTNKEMYMYAVILVIVCVLVYIIKTRKFDHIAEISVISGGIINVILFLISSIALGVDISMGKLILWTLVSMLISYVVESFTRVLDYTRVENVRFEDDDYYYYVKAVPKAKITASQNKIKNITKMEKEKTIDETLEHDLSFVGETLKRSVNETEDDLDLDESDDLDDLQRVDDFNDRL